MTALLDFVKAEVRKRGAFMRKVEPSVLDGDERWLAALKKQGFFPNPYAVHVRNEWVLDLRPDEKARSEEHTSELQSHLNLVCRLLLEKKKKLNTIQKTNYNSHLLHTPSRH